MTGKKYRECKQCRETFESSREWQLFCSNSCRYTFHNENSHLCFYCSDVASARDHVLPVKVRVEFRRSYNQETVPVCSDCNCQLGGKEDKSFRDRMTRLIKKHCKKNKLLNPEIEWAPSELHELGPTLRSHVTSSVRARKGAELRLVYMLGVLFWWNDTQKRKR